MILTGDVSDVFLFAATFIVNIMRLIGITGSRQTKYYMYVLLPAHVHASVPQQIGTGKTVYLQPLPYSRLLEHLRATSTARYNTTHVYGPCPRPVDTSSVDRAVTDVAAVEDG